MFRRWDIFACFHPIVSQILGSQEAKKSSENTRASRHTEKVALTGLIQEISEQHYKYFNTKKDSRLKQTTPSANEPQTRHRICTWQFWEMFKIRPRSNLPLILPKQTPANKDLEKLKLLLSIIEKYSYSLPVKSSNCKMIWRLEENKFHVYNSSANVINIWSHKSL